MKLGGGVNRSNLAELMESNGSEVQDELRE
jgi:hypothetical protein